MSEIQVRGLRFGNIRLKKVVQADQRLDVHQPIATGLFTGRNDVGSELFDFRFTRSDDRSGGLQQNNLIDPNLGQLLQHPAEPITFGRRDRHDHLSLLPTSFGLS